MSLISFLYHSVNIYHLIAFPLILVIYLYRIRISEKGLRRYLKVETIFIIMGIYFIGVLKYFLPSLRITIFTIISELIGIHLVIKVFFVLESESWIYLQRLPHFIFLAFILLYGTAQIIPLKIQIDIIGFFNILLYCIMAFTLIAFVYIGIKYKNMDTLTLFFLFVFVVISVILPRGTISTIIFHYLYISVGLLIPLIAVYRQLIN